jgi:hypothetical protein
MLSNISYLNSPPHYSPLSPSPPIPGIVSTGIIFSIYIREFTVLALFSPSHTLSSPLPFFHWYHTYPQAGPVLPSCSPIFVNEKRKMTFCLFKIATQGVSL